MEFRDAEQTTSQSCDTCRWIFSRNKCERADDRRKFRGMYVCEKLPTTRDILLAPIDLVIKGDNVQFGRPLFNLNGTRVVGTEMAAGTINGDGQLHLTSEWNFLGNTANGDYSGSLTKTGGTMTGKQTWTGPGGATPVVRTCTVALVPAAAATPQQR
jgi:hypothetical protein